MRLILAILFAIVVVLMYRVWEPFVSRGPKSKVEPNHANLYFFYTDWCGWSKKAQPEIAKLEQTLSVGGKFGNTQVKLVRVNADEDKAKAEMYEVEAYPTILVEDSKVIREFTKPVKYENLIAFLRSTYGEESVDAAEAAAE